MRRTSLRVFVPEQGASGAPYSRLALLHTPCRSLLVCALAQRWKTLFQHMNTLANKSTIVTWTTKLPHTFWLCLYVPLIWMEEAIGTLAVLIFSCCSPFSLFFPFFFCSDVSRGLPQLFYQVILLGRQPRTAALFILCYGDGGIGSPDRHFDDMQRRGKDSLQRLHLLSPVPSPPLRSSSGTQES